MMDDPGPDLADEPCVCFLSNELQNNGKYSMNKTLGNSDQ